MKGFTSAEENCTTNCTTTTNTSNFTTHGVFTNHLCTAAYPHLGKKWAMRMSTIITHHVGRALMK